MHAFSRNPIKLERKERKYFLGSNQGNLIGPVALPNYKDLWRVPSTLKKDMYGKNGKVPVGGQCQHLNVTSCGCSSCHSVFPVAAW